MRISEWDKTTTTTNNNKIKTLLPVVCEIVPVVVFVVVVGVVGEVVVGVLPVRACVLDKKVIQCGVVGGPL